jgi:hypothetical protein
LEKYILNEARYGNGSETAFGVDVNKTEEIVVEEDCDYLDLPVDEIPEITDAIIETENNEPNGGGGSKAEDPIEDTNKDIGDDGTDEEEDDETDEDNDDEEEEPVTDDKREQDQDINIESEEVLLDTDTMKVIVKELSQIEQNIEKTLEAEKEDEFLETQS